MKDCLLLSWTFIVIIYNQKMDSYIFKTVLDTEKVIYVYIRKNLNIISFVLIWAAENTFKSFALPGKNPRIVRSRTNKLLVHLHEYEDYTDNILIRQHWGYCCEADAAYFKWTSFFDLQHVFISLTFMVKWKWSENFSEQWFYIIFLPSIIFLPNLTFARLQNAFQREASSWTTVITSKHVSEQSFKSGNRDYIIRRILTKIISWGWKLSACNNNCMSTSTIRNMIEWRSTSLINFSNECFQNEMRRTKMKQSRSAKYIIGSSFNCTLLCYSLIECEYSSLRLLSFF